MYRKFKNKTVSTAEGVFDSMLEYEHWLELKARAEAGEIQDLRRQVPFELIPRQTEWVEKQLKTKTKMVEIFREHPVNYIADFVYYENGKQIIEDSKGMPTPDYIIKRKLMRWQGTPITEVKLNRPKDYIKLHKAKKKEDITEWTLCGEYANYNSRETKTAKELAKDIIKEVFDKPQRKRKEFIYINTCKGGNKSLQVYYKEK